MKINEFGLARFLAASAAAALLASCGGGGGGDSPAPSVPTAPLAINAQNTQQVTTEALSAAVGAVAQAGVIGGLSAESVAPKTHILMNILRREAGRMGTQSRQTLAVEPKTPVTTICTDGGNEVDDVTPNVSSTTTFNACNEGGIILNGSISISFTSNGANGTFSGHTNINLTSTVPIQGQAPATLVFTGDFDIIFTVTGPAATPTAESAEIKGSVLRISLSSGGSTFFQELSNFDITSALTFAAGKVTGETDTVIFSYASTSLGGKIDVTNPTPFQTTTTAAGSGILRNFPHAGVLVITGAASKLTVTVNGDETLLPATNQVTVQLDIGNNGSVDQTFNFAWASI